MRNHFLRAVKAPNIRYVGGRTIGTAGTNANLNIGLTTLTGGLASSPSAGDLIIVAFATGSISNRNMSTAVSGYTSLIDLYSNSTFDTNLGVNYKFSTGSDTQFSLPSGTFSIQDAGAVYVTVWRGVNTSVPFDVTSTTSTLTTTANANPPAITPTTIGSYIVAIGATGTGTGVGFTSSGLTEFLTSNGSDNNNLTIGGGYVQWTSGSFDPAAFTFSGTDSTTFSSAAVTLALRPA